MARVTFRFDGLSDLRAALRRLPAELAQEAGPIVLDAANAAAADVKGQYPVHTGNLESHVVVSKATAGRWGAAAQVRSTARHAWIFEKGTEVRQTRTWRGQPLARPANRGRMPKAQIAVGTFMRHRRRMEDALAALLERAGLEVRRG